MKPLSIADYLDHLGRAAGEKAPPPQSSPFRPRSLPGPQGEAAKSRPLFDRGAKPTGAETQGEDSPRRTPWAPKPVPLAERRSPPAAAAEPVKTEEVAVRLAEAFARGREEGLAEGRAEALESHVAELAAMREQAETERQAFHVNEHIEFEGAIRSGLRQIEQSVGAAVTRILAPFLSEQVVKRAVDELSDAIARISAGGSPGLIRIRGPQRLLAPLRERIAGLPIEVEYAEDEGAETVVEANATQIVTGLRPWAELMASFEA
ncbi:MAG TPA: hypothetical protein VGG79_07280 [Roseiarcus sp.]|jgi:hypothetical protein